MGCDMTEKKPKGFISSGIDGIVGLPTTSSNTTPLHERKSTKPVTKAKIAKPPTKTPKQKKAQDALDDAYHEQMNHFKHANYSVNASSLKIPNTLVTRKDKSTHTKEFLINYYRSKYHLVFVYASNNKFVYKIHDLMYQDFLYKLYSHLSQQGLVLRDRKLTPNELKIYSQSIDVWINLGIADGKYHLLEKSEANQKHQRTMNLIKNLEVKPHQNSDV